MFLCVRAGARVRLTLALLESFAFAVRSSAVRRKNLHSQFLLRSPRKATRHFETSSEEFPHPCSPLLFCSETVSSTLPYRICCVASRRFVSLFSLLLTAFVFFRIAAPFNPAMFKRYPCTAHEMGMGCDRPGLSQTTTEGHEARGRANCFAIAHSDVYAIVKGSARSRTREGTRLGDPKRIETLNSGCPLRTTRQLELLRE